jgi:pimeloyl-ACP methyl ester carboxylesterase
VRILQASVIAAVLVSGCGRSLLYGRTHTTPEQLAALSAKPGFQGATLSVGELDLNGLVSIPRDPAAPWILFFGGNASSIKNNAWIVATIRGDADMGLAVFAYRGYDGSEGKPTQKSLIRDGVAAAKKLEEELGVNPERLVLVGQSLGGGVAAQVARRLQEDGRAPAGLVMVSPFTSVPHVAAHHVGCAPACLFPDPWRTFHIAPEVRVPALVIHGNRDDVIPMEQGKRVSELLPDARFVEIDGLGHNDIWEAGAAGDVRAFVLERAR